MSLEAIVDDEFIQPLRGALTAENMIATRQLIESVKMESSILPNREEVKVYAESYILELRDGEQYKSPPTIDGIKIWVEAKGLDGVLDPYAVLGTILSEGTTWDKQGGSVRLKEVISDDNLQRIMNIAVEDEIANLKNIKWLSR